MSDKLLTVRIDEATRDSFSDWAKSQGTNTSELIKSFIAKCLDNSIDVADFTLKPSRQLDSNLDSQLDKIEDSVYTKLTESIDDKLGEQYSRLVDIFNEELEKRDKAITECHLAIATIKTELLGKS